VRVTQDPGEEKREEEKPAPTFRHLVEDHVDQDVRPTSSRTVAAQVGERPRHRMEVGGERETF